MKNIILFSLCLIVLNSYAQHSTQAHQQQQIIKIGDKIPDQLISDFLDRSHQAMHLSDLYKKGGLIINFWATWCSPCLEELPVLANLASKYKTKLGVLSVEYEQPALVSKFLVRHPELNSNKLNLIAGDTLLVEYFKHRSLPYNIWIDSVGVVRYITHGDEINEKNIVQFIHGGKIKATISQDKINFSFTAPFHYQDSSFLYRSILTKYTPGIPSGFNVLTKSASSANWLIDRIYIFNNSIASLYRIAYTKLITSRYQGDPFNLVEFHVRDSIKYFSPTLNSGFYKRSDYTSRQDWASDHTYCYDLTLPRPTDSKEAFDLMLDDLQRAFHLNIKFENQLRPRTIISLPDKSKLKLIKQSIKDTSVVRRSKTGMYVQNQKIAFLFEYLNDKFSPTLNSVPEDQPYINETGIDFPVDLSLDYDKPNPTYKEIKEAFEKKYGFKFSVENRSVPILIVSE